MEYARELANEEKKQERRNESFILFDAVDRHYYPNTTYFPLRWELTVYKDISKRPKLTNFYQRSESNLSIDDVEAHIKFILIFLENYQREIKVNVMDEFLQSEFLKVVYDHIKIELAYNRTSSRILNYIIENNFNKEAFISMIKADIEEINNLTFADVEFIKHLNASIEIHDLLSPQVIRNIVMCADYELIKEASKNILEHNKNNVSKSLDSIKSKLRKEIASKKEKLKAHRKALNNLFLVKTVAFVALIATITGVTVYAKSQVDEEVPLIFKTTYTTYSNVASPNIEESYSETIEENNTTLKIYSEAYLEDGILYRDIETYSVEDFTDTSQLEKYFTYDFSIITPIDVDYKVRVNESDNTEEYREILKVTQSQNDMIHSMSTLNYLFSLLLYVIMLGAIPFYIEETSIAKLKRNYKKENEYYELLKEEARQIVQELNGDIDKISVFLNDSIALCDEIIGKEDVESLTEEEKELIRQYENFRKKCSEYLERIATDEINTYIKKHEKKQR